MRTVPTMLYEYSLLNCFRSLLQMVRGYASPGSPSSSHSTRPVLYSFPEEEEEEEEGVGKTVNVSQSGSKRTFGKQPLLKISPNITGADVVDIPRTP